MRNDGRRRRRRVILTGTMSARRSSWLVGGLLAALLIPLYLWIPQHLRHDPLIGPLGSRYHIGLFLALTLLLYQHGPLRGRLRLVVLVCLLLGAATEVAQTLVGRTASLADWSLDAQGVGFAVCWIWYRRTGRRALPLFGAAVLVAFVVWPLRNLPVTVQEARAARARFPLLEDFERPQSLALWSRHGNIPRSRVPVPGRGHVLQVDNDDEERWPGVSSRRMPFDWSGYAELRVDCRLVPPSPDSLRVTVWVEDRAGRRDVDFAKMTFTVGHRWQTLVVPLADLETDRRGRAVSGAEIQAVSVFVSRRDPGPLSFQIDDLRLTGAQQSE